MSNNMVNIALIMAIFIGVLNCSNKNLIKPTQTEIDTFIEEHPDLPELDKTCISKRRFEVGMRSTTVLFLLGEPNNKVIFAVLWSEGKWFYTKGREKIYQIKEGIVIHIIEE